MEEKLDSILEKLEEMSSKLEELEERIDEMESNNYGQYNDMLCEVQGISQFIETIYEYQELDFQKFESENLIFIHTNALRTASFINALVKSYRRLHMMNKMTEKELTPEFLAQSVALDEKDSNVVSGEIFSYSPEFEKIITHAIEGQKSYFIILTNNIQDIPQSLREKMRVIQ